MMRNVFGFVLVVATGCGGSPRSSAPPAPAPAAVLELGEVVLLDGDEAALKVHADGTTELGYRSGSLRIEPGTTASTDSLPLQLRPGPTLAADGTISFRGEAIAKVNVDGTVLALKTNQTVPGVQITGDRIAFGSAVAFEVAADGTLTQAGGNPVSNKKLHLTGADTPGKRRAIFGLMAIAMHGGKAEAAKESVSETPASVP